MSLLAVILLAVALSLDAFAVAVASGCALRPIRREHYARIGGAFGFFQFFMPVLGWLLGQSVHRYIAAWDHWVAFALLAWVGGNMLRGAWKDFHHHGGEAAPMENAAASLSWGTLLVLAVATSIDALAVGLTLAMTDTPILRPAVIIGLTCAAISAAGLHLGRVLAGMAVLQRWAGLAGGLALLAIGFRVLWQDGVFG
ncbi:MAG TPA: manganese efflux pump MntP family protein [Candidatus Desulfovibrio intestinavium]|uniref:Putative manganese efflux pump MntP n=1 Tax=Candidatus Desulfovibrio intestinavium TaxID=2838534 RepID=A0A9D2HN29_9BACT|nr:manganese efflux pump MntP family protein [Candidatus Desulfovibrio intestinavium]